jgi:hypothetical protein
VFTPSGGVGAGAKSAVGDPVLGHPANNSLSGAAYGQPMDLAAILQQQQQKPASAAPGGPTALSQQQQYNQAATQDLKSAIGIGAPAVVGGGGIKPVAAGVGELSGVYGNSALSYSTGRESFLYAGRLRRVLYVAVPVS